MTNSEAYMLPRDSQESQRLNAQHELMRTLSSGLLIHPSIPYRSLRNVADVATGTGIWLRELAVSPPFSNQSDGQKTKFVGFDISQHQFPSPEALPPGIDFVVQDMTKPFPVHYHEKFDLVNVRLVSYAIKAVELEQTVRHVLQILRPGGYLQWQECDASDSWTTPETPMATDTINNVIFEKIARGLLPGIATPLLKIIQSYSIEVPKGKQNLISWSPDLMRIKHLETVSTLNHPSPAVAAVKNMVVISAASNLLESSISRKKAAATDPSTSNMEAKELAKEIESLNELMDAIKRGDGDACNNWNFELTWIVARKAIVVDEKEAWMSIKNPSQ